MLASAVQEVQRWPAVVERAFNHRVAEGLYFNLGRLGLLGRCGARSRRALERAFAVNQLVISLLLEEEQSLVREIGRQDVKATLLDAPSLTTVTYPEVSARHHDGLEFCVDNDRDLERLRACLVDSGYQPIGPDQWLWRILLALRLAPYYLKNPTGVYHKLIRTERFTKHFTCFPYHPILFGPLLLSYVRIRKVRALTRSRCQPGRGALLPGQPSVTHIGSRSEDAIALLCMRAYRDILLEWQRQLRYLFDVVALVGRCEGHLDWPAVYRKAIECGGVAPVFYVLGQIRQILAFPIPESFLAKLASSAEFTHSDFGDFLPVLLEKPFVAAVEFEE